MVEYLEKACRSLEMAERYEVLGDIYKLIIPIYEYSRDFDVSRLKAQIYMYSIS